MWDIRGKFHDIDLLNEGRRPLYDYLHHGGRDLDSPYVFTSQRHAQLTEEMQREGLDG